VLSYHKEISSDIPLQAVKAHILQILFYRIWNLSFSAGNSENA